MKRYTLQTLRSIRELSSTRSFQILYGISALFIVFSVALLFWQLIPEAIHQFAVPLHYNIHFGVDRFGRWWFIFTAPAMALGIALFNALVSVLLWKRDRTLSYFFSAVALLCAGLLFVASVFVVLLNLSFYG